MEWDSLQKAEDYMKKSDKQIELSNNKRVIAEIIAFADKYREENKASMSYNMLIIYACEHEKREWMETLRGRNNKAEISARLRAHRRISGVPYGMREEESQIRAMEAKQKYENRLMVEMEECAHKEHEEECRRRKNETE